MKNKTKSYYINSEHAKKERRLQALKTKKEKEEQKLLETTSLGKLIH